MTDKLKLSNRYRMNYVSLLPNEACDNHDVKYFHKD